MPRYLLAFAAAALLAIPALCAPPPKEPPGPPEPKSEFVKFVKVEATKGKKTGMIKVTLVGSNKTGNLPFELSEAEISTLKDLKGGEYLTIDVLKKDNRDTVTAVTVYELKPGEEEENVYVYNGTEEKNVGGHDVIVMNTTKLGKEHPFTIPSQKDPKEKKVVPKEDFRTALADLSEGDSIEVIAGPGPAAIVKAVRKYEAPKIGTFVKVTEETVEKAKVTTVVLKDDNDTDETITVPAKNSGLIANVKKFKEGDKVQYRAAEEKGTLTLVEIKKAPKDATSRPSKDKKEETDKPEKKEKPKLAPLQ